ncbi:MAG: hypothetical protein ACRD2R_00740 [Terriglobales bacterium]
MPDPATQLQRLLEAGFEFQTFERYPRHLGATRDGCIALLEATPEGLKMIGAPGWRMGEVMGVVVLREGRKVFQAKNEFLDATPERLELLTRFQVDLGGVLQGE